MKNRKLAVGLAAIVLLLVLGTVVLVASGSYNVAATAPHTRVTEWLLNTVQERSVAVRADDVPSPPPLDAEMVRHGFEEYRAMCATCHGAPGVERGEIGKGINPEPPDLAEEAAEWSDRELFWITKHGIKLAGMPAFGATHSDEALWGIVAFLRRLQRMSSEEYRLLASAADERGEAHGEAHAAAAQPRAVMHGTVEPPHAAGHARAALRRRVVDSPPAVPPRADTGATQKLKVLATELMRDAVVMERIRLDSALRRRWEDENVRRHLTSPPGALHE
jgi:mono/diheme cytochrome c family protein